MSTFDSVFSGLSPAVSAFTEWFTGKDREETSESIPDPENEANGIVNEPTNESFRDYSRSLPSNPISRSDDVDDDDDLELQISGLSADVEADPNDVDFFHQDKQEMHATQKGGDVVHKKSQVFRPIGDQRIPSSIPHITGHRNAFGVAIEKTDDSAWYWKSLTQKKLKTEGMETSMRKFLERLHHGESERMKAHQDTIQQLRMQVTEMAAMEREEERTKRSISKLLDRFIGDSERLEDHQDTIQELRTQATERDAIKREEEITKRSITRKTEIQENARQQKDLQQLHSLLQEQVVEDEASSRNIIESHHTELTSTHVDYQDTVQSLHNSVMRKDDEMKENLKRNEVMNQQQREIMQIMNDQQQQERQVMYEKMRDLSMQSQDQEQQLELECVLRGGLNEQITKLWEKLQALESKTHQKDQENMGLNEILKESQEQQERLRLQMERERHRNDVLTAENRKCENRSFLQKEQVQNLQDGIRKQQGKLVEMQEKCDNLIHKNMELMSIENGHLRQIDELVANNDTMRDNMTNQKNTIDAQRDTLTATEGDLRQRDQQLEDMKFRYDTESERVMALDKSYHNLFIVAITVGSCLGFAVIVLIILFLLRIKRDKRKSVIQRVSGKHQVSPPPLSFERIWDGSLLREPLSSNSSWSMHQTMYDEFGLVQPWQEWEERKKRKNKRNVLGSESVDLPEVNKKDVNVVIDVLEIDKNAEEAKASTNDGFGVKEEKASAPPLKGDSFWPLRLTMFDEFGVGHKQDTCKPATVERVTMDDDDKDVVIEIPENEDSDVGQFNHKTFGESFPEQRELKASAPTREESTSVEENVTFR